MARPAGANAEATKARILSIASQLFADRGRDGVTMRPLARQAGVTQATVHHYFGSKEELYDAVIAGLYAPLAELQVEMAQLLSGGHDFSGLVEHGVRLTFRFGIKKRHAVRLAYRHTLDTGMPPTAGSRSQETLLDTSAVGIAAVTGRSPSEVRFMVASVTMLIIRYVVMSPREAALVVSGKSTRRKTHAPEVLDQMEAHLVTIAKRLLMPSAAP